MKTAHFLFWALSLTLLALPGEAGAQSIVKRGKVTVVGPGRPARTIVYRNPKPVARRTLKRLPAGARSVVYRSVRYYSVDGMYYVSGKGVFVRSFPPVGFRIRSLSPDPVRIVVRGRPYWYAAGVFYLKDGRDYVVADTPVGAVVRLLPEDAAAVEMDGNPAFELNGVIYEQLPEGYRVVYVKKVDK